MPALGDDGPFTARVFKTVIDPYLGKVSMMRVLSGKLKAGEALRDTTQDSDVRTAAPLRARRARTSTRSRSSAPA
jgi:translation elongation factor EF-G